MSSKNLTIMTFNAHHGRVSRRKFIDLHEIADTILKHKVDIACLQEIDNGTRRTGRTHQTEEIARLANMHFVFGSSRRRSGGEFGNAILSRFKIRESERRFMSKYSLFQQRSLITAQIKFHGSKITIINTHLGIVGEERARQIRDIMAYSESLDNSVILCGDFNTRPKQKMLDLLKYDFIDAVEEAKAKNVRTFHARLPLVRYDYIFRKYESPLSCRSVQVGKPNVSDHLPLIAVYNLNKSN